MDWKKGSGLNTHKKLDEYFQAKERERLQAKGYKIPTIGDHNIAKAVISRTYNKLEKEFCKAIMYAYKKQEPVHAGMLKNLRRLVEKYKVERIKLQ